MMAPITRYIIRALGSCVFYVVTAYIMRTSCHYWATLFLALQVGRVSRIGTIKYGQVPQDSDLSGTALARTSSNSKLQTRPLVREGTTK
jgi:hypothetical protein